MKLVLGKQNLFVAVSNGILEFKENKLTVIAQDAFIGRDKDNVKANLDKIIKQRLEANRASSVDFTEKERDLIDSIKKSGAGKL